MIYRNYISEALYYGRRLESLHKISNHWNISISAAAELVVNFEERQAYNIDKYKINDHIKSFKENIEGKVFYPKYTYNDDIVFNQPIFKFFPLNCTCL